MIRLSSALFVGSYLSDAMSSEPFVVYRATSPTEGPKAWTPAGLLCEALCVRALVPDPSSPIETSLEPLMQGEILQADADRAP